ncbi:DNA methyltransferase [Candidatus Alkanophaga liquidiphilum]
MCWQKVKKRQDVWELKDPPYPTYPTEKNLEMLKTIIEASSNPDDIVLDCFVGSGTTLIAAEETGRRWIGIDNSKIAIETCQKRINKMKHYSAYTLFEIVKNGGVENE